MNNENYTPYGEEWKKEMAKLPKAVLIDIAANLGKEKQILEDTIKSFEYSYNRIRN